MYVYTKIYMFTLTYTVYTRMCTFTLKYTSLRFGRGGPKAPRGPAASNVYTNITEGHVLATLSKSGKEGVSTLWKVSESPNIPFTLEYVRLHKSMHVYTNICTFTLA